MEKLSDTETEFEKNHRAWKRLKAYFIRVDFLKE